VNTLAFRAKQKFFQDAHFEPWRRTSGNQEELVS
jgi:hypothetical protein